MKNHEAAKKRWEGIECYAILYCDERQAIDRSRYLIITLFDSASTTDAVDGTTLGLIASELSRYRVRKRALEHELLGRESADSESPELISELKRIREVLRHRPWLGANQ